MCCHCKNVCEPIFINCIHYSFKRVMSHAKNHLQLAVFRSFFLIPSSSFFPLILVSSSPIFPLCLVAHPLISSFCIPTCVFALPSLLIRTSLFAVITQLIHYQLVHRAHGGDRSYGVAVGLVICMMALSRLIRLQALTDICGVRPA